MQFVRCKTVEHPVTFAIPHSIAVFAMLPVQSKILSVSFLSVCISWFTTLPNHLEDTVIVCTLGLNIFNKHSSL